MLSWVVIPLLLVIGFGLTGRASAAGSVAQRPFLTLLAMAPVAALVAYAVYRDSYWLAAFGIPVAISGLRTQHPQPIAAEALAAEIRAHLRNGRVLLITVAQHGTLRVFRARRGARMSTKGFRLIDQCPHCFVEGRLSAMFNDTVAGGEIEHYRAKLANNRPVELQLTRSMAPPTGALVVDAPGEPWVLHYFYPSNRTWRVPFPVACDVHNPAALEHLVSDPEE